MKQYHDMLREIMDRGVDRGDRTGVGTRGLFGLQTRYRMEDGFPAVTTKRLPFKTVASELLWFLSGSRNINDLKAILKSNRIWDANYEDFRARNNGLIDGGECGYIYGYQWRRWNGFTDQLANAINTIIHNPDSRRIIVSAWDPERVGPEDVALPPCHVMFQFFVANGRLSLQMYQRSADMFLGVPFNIASYALLLHMVAQVTETEPDTFIHTIGDAHIYLNHFDQVEELLSREARPLPSLYVKRPEVRNIDDFVLDDFHLHNYNPHDTIKADMAV